jgi:urease accessory protein
MNGISTRAGMWIMLLAAAAVLACPVAAQAHPGGAGHDLLDGVEHPLTGLDHVCAMVAVGIFAAQRGGRAVWLVPLAFIVAMAAGGALGMAGVHVPLVEPGILLSLVVLGLLVAAAVRMPLAACVALVGLFALAHGHAHGTEVSAGASGLAYVAGFIAATAILHALGIAFGLSMQRLKYAQLIRLAGAAVAICGLYLVIQ